MIKFEDIKSEYPFKSNFIKVKSYNYHYVDEGGGKETLLMIHGNLSWSFMYRNLIREFSKNYRVIAPDHLGCGLSDKPQDFPYRLETHIDNLESLLFSLKLEKVTLVVHDWGAAIGVGLAARHPGKIARLIILNSTAFSTTWLPLRLAILRIPWLDNKLIRSLNLFLNTSLQMSCRKALPSIVRKGFKYPYQTCNDRIAILRFVQDIPIDPEHISFEVLLEIEHGLWMFRETPVYIIWGMRDWCFSPRYLRRWQLYYPQAQVLKLDDAGHYLLEDECDKAIATIKDFLESSTINTEIQ
ncbi:MAG: alpha/beta fold hydrolase [Victivallaceae bacterium]|nr:alpha/beta fold hydrolase [Victivallaceae bacterium]